MAASKKTYISILRFAPSNIYTSWKTLLTLWKKRERNTGSNGVIAHGKLTMFVSDTR